MSSSVNLTGSNQSVITRPVRYCGFSIRETAGSTALVRIFDHATAASGTVLDEVALAAGESAREFYGSDGAPMAQAGIYVQVVSGSVAGSVRVA